MKKDLTVGSPLKLIIYFTIPLLIGNLFQQLYNTITAQKFGNKDEAGVRRSVAASFILSFIINIILTLLSVILAGWLLHVIKTPLELYDNAYEYIVIIFWGTGAAILFNLFSNMLISNNSKFTMF